MIKDLTNSVLQIRERQGETQNTVRKVLREEIGSLQNRWLIGAGSLLIGILGISLSVVTNKTILPLVQTYGAVIGIGLTVTAAVALAIIARQK